MKEKDLSEEALLVVVGAGAVGSAIAALFQSVGCRVALMGRLGLGCEKRTVQRADGSTLIYTPEYDGQNKHVLHSTLNSAAPKIFFLTVKAYDLWSVWQDIRAQLRPQSIVISLSNGYVRPVLQKIAHDLPEDIYLRWGITNMGVKRINQELYEIGSLAAAKISWGPVKGLTNEAPEQVMEKLLQSKVRQCRFDYDIELQVAEKWIFNTALNTLCGAYRLPENGLSLSVYGTELYQLFNEAYQCAGHLFPDVQLSELAELWEKLKHLIQVTANNTNSLVADVLAGRRTESEFFAGACSQLKEDSLLKTLHKKL